MRTNPAAVPPLGDLAMTLLTALGPSDGALPPVVVAVD
jgi:hypothetical protein